MSVIRPTLTPDRVELPDLGAAVLARALLFLATGLVPSRIRCRRSPGVGDLWSKR